MPKKTAQEVVQEISAFDLLTQNASAADKYIEYAANVDDPEAQDDTELEGLKQAIAAQITAVHDKHLSDESAGKLFKLSNGLLQRGTELKFEAGLKIDRIKEKIKQGQYPGTEFLLDDELSREDLNGLARNIFIAENPDLVKKIKGQELAAKLLNEQLNGYTCNTSVEVGEGEQKREELRVVAFNDLVEQYKAANTQAVIDNKFANAANKAQEYGAITGESLKLDDMIYGFAVNPEYKPGDDQIDLFSKQPEAIEDYIACNTIEDYQKEKEKSEFKKDACDKYIDNAKKLAKNAKAMLDELDKIERTDGKENSKEYNEMRSALEDLIALGSVKVDEQGKETQPDFTAQQFVEAIDKVNDTAAAYQKKNDAIYKRHDFGRERVNMSKRLQNLCAIAKPIMDADKYGLNEFQNISEIKSDEDLKIARLENARKKKGFEEFEPHRKKIPTIEERIIRAKRNAQAASEGVKGGSSEYKKAVGSYDKLEDIYKRLQEVKNDNEMDTNQKRNELTKLNKELQENKKLMDKYITRKQNKGQIQVGATTDLKSTKRINAVYEGMGILFDIDKQIKALRQETYELDKGLQAQDLGDIYSINKFITQEGVKYKQQALEKYRSAPDKEQKGSYMEKVAQYAQRAFLKLSEISNATMPEQFDPQRDKVESLRPKMDKPLTQEQKQEALAAIAVLAYHDMLSTMDKTVINSTNLPRDNVLQGQLTEFMQSPGFKRIYGDGSGLKREQIEDVLADPSFITKNIMTNRKTINEINRQVENQNLIRNDPLAMQANQAGPIMGGNHI